jgi:hypothetical protein
MKKTLIAALGILSAGSLLAENAVILESFETNIDSATLMNWGGRPAADPVGVTLTQYTKTGDDDLNVTQGTNSLMIELSGSEWWSADFRITLSDEASAKVREAVQSTNVARYVLRYDLIFPPTSEYSWMNSQIFFGSLSDQLESPGGKATMSFSLDLITGLPEEGPISIIFAQNFDATEDPFTKLTIYLDTIRLVDTYAPGAVPVVYVLQSFEDSQNPTGGAADFTGWGGTVRTTYKQYTTTGPEDIRVTEGTNALQVDYANAGTWHADFTIPFNDTKLAEVLRLDLPAEERPTPDQLARYTLRFDVTYPDRAEDWSAGWMNTSYQTLAQGLPWSQSRPDNATGQRVTYSITLDQISRWADWVDPKPVLMFIANGAWGDSGTSVYYDNFRLIDTGNVPVPTAFKITAFQFDAKTSTVTITWESNPQKTYDIEYTENLASWPTKQATGIQGATGATTTTYTGKLPTATLGFLRVRMN